MLSQISSFFSGLKSSSSSSGKSKKAKTKTKNSNWYDDANNGSLGLYDDLDFVQPHSYLWCLGRSGSSSDSNSRQRRNSKTASTQSLDKLSKQKDKSKALRIGAASSMLDLNSASRKSKRDKKNDNNNKFSASSSAAAASDRNGSSDEGRGKKKGLELARSHRLGFGKFKKEGEVAQGEPVDRRDSKERQKNERLKRGASWRHAYRKGSIINESGSGALPRVNTEERFVVGEKSSPSSSNSSQNASNDTKHARFNVPPNEFSSTLHLANIPQFEPHPAAGVASLTGSAWNVNIPPRRDKPSSSSSSSSHRDKENRPNEARKSKTAITIQRTDSASGVRSPPDTPTSTPPQRPPFISSHHLPPPPPPPIPHPPSIPPAPFSPQKADDVDSTPFSNLLRKASEPSGNSRTTLVNAAQIGGSCVDVGIDPGSTRTPHGRKGSVKVEDLVQRMNLSDLTKFSPGTGALSTPLPAPRKPHQHHRIGGGGDDGDGTSGKKQKENFKTPPPMNAPSARTPTGRAQTAQVHQVPAKQGRRNNELIAKRLDYDGDVRIYDQKTGTVYTKGKLLGKGGFAKCYEMKDFKNHKIFAGKIMSKHSLAKKNQMEKIIREIELHFCLCHKNIVGFHSFFEDNNNVFIILELCSRKSLVHLLKVRKTLTEPEVRYYMKHLTNGVKYIHGQKVIHRDLKLGNMLLNSNMELKIADFGLATRVEYDGEIKSSVCGTPNYIAPEVLQKTGYSYEADIWAMGCIMYAMLCGRPPFESSSLKETYTRIATNKYATPQHVSVAARSLIKHLLTSEPYLRPTLERISMDNFFQDGFMPEELSPATCESRPKFPLTSINLNNEVNKTKSNKVKVVHASNADNAGGNMAQSKNSRKSASQILTRAKATEFESAASSNMKEEYSVGSAPSIPRNLNSSLRGNATHPVSPSRLLDALNNQLELLDEKKGDPLPVGAVGIQPGNTSKWSRGSGVFVMKWVDYSNKYGFGYLLSNGAVGILFLDGTKILLGANSTIQVETPSGEKASYSTCSVPAHLQQKTTILMRFMEFMEAHLVAGGNMQAPPGASAFLQRWFRTEKAIVMSLTDGTVQVNFIWDHIKVILNFEDGQQDSVYLTVIDTNRQASTYPLKALSSIGCSPDMVGRLRYVASMIESIVSKEGNNKE